MTSSDAQYWLDVGEQWAGAGRDSLWRRHCDAVSARLLARWLPQGPVPRVLKTDLFDEALTAGLQHRLCRSAGLVVGIDLSQAIVREATRRCPDVGGLRADVRQLPFADDVFDAVVSLSTLDHFRAETDVVVSLHELRRTLRPQGLLLLTMDNAVNPLVALRNALPFAWLNRLGLVPYYVGATCGPRRTAAT